MADLNKHLRRSLSSPLVLAANIIHSHVHSCSRTINLLSKRYIWIINKIRTILIQWITVSYIRREQGLIVTLHRTLFTELNFYQNLGIHITKCLCYVFFKFFLFTPSVIWVMPEKVGIRFLNLRFNSWVSLPRPRSTTRGTLTTLPDFGSLT